MNLVFFSDNYIPETNAAASRVHERARILVSNFNCQVTVITSCPNMPIGRPLGGYKNSWYAQEVIDSVNVIRVKTFMTANSGIFRRCLDYLSYLPLSIAAGLRLPKADAYIACSPHLLVPLSGAVVSCIKRIPLFTEIADIWPDSVEGVGISDGNSFLFKFLSMLERFVYRRSRGVVTLTETIRMHVIGRSGQDIAVRTILNGADHVCSQIVDSSQLREQFFWWRVCSGVGVFWQFWPRSGYSCLA